MYKFIDCGSWNRIGLQPAQFVKVASTGLGESDKRQLVTERRVPPLFADKIASLKLGSGDLPIHLIALASYEYWGDNRNGDAFRADALKNTYQSFLKSARHYRDHKSNEAPYGVVKLAAYNDDMHRVELLVIANGSKEAADRNGGRVLPQSSIDKLYRGEDLIYSMGVKIAHDICSNCGNKAPTRAQYCTEATCYNEKTGRRMPGCRKGLTKIASDGFRQFVYNPEPLTFYDISEITTVQADPTATGALADYLHTKTASKLLGSAEIADLYMPQNILLPNTGENAGVYSQLGVLQKLAAMENVFNVKEKSCEILAAALQNLPAPDIAEFTPRTTQSAAKLASVLRGFADEDVYCDIETFAKLAGISNADVSIDGIFNELFYSPAAESILANNPFVKAEVSLSDRRQIKQACLLATPTDDNLRKAARQSVLRQATASRTKNAVNSSNSEFSALRHLYAMYKIAMLLPRQIDADFDKHCWQTVARHVRLP